MSFLQSEKVNLRGRRVGEQKSLEEEEIRVDNDCCGGRVGHLFHCLCSGNSLVLNLGARYYFLCFSSLSGWSADTRISLRVLWIMPGVCGKIKVLAVASAGHHPILRCCGVDGLNARSHFTRNSNHVV